MLRSGSCYVLTKVENLQSLMTSTRCKTTTKPRRSQSSHHTTVEIPSGVHGSHRKPWEETGTSKHGTFEGPAFHDFEITLSLDPWKKTSTTSLDPCYNTARRACLKSARRTLRRSKRRSQREDMTSGKC